mgnify:CR=1 FL=1
MDLGLNEIQTMLQNLAREFMETEMPTTRVLEIDDSPSGFAVEVWEKMGEIGWPGMAIPGHATANGKNILSRMPPARLAHHLGIHPLQQLTAQTVTVDWRLTAELTDAVLIHNDQQYKLRRPDVWTPVPS